MAGLLSPPAPAVLEHLRRVRALLVDLDGVVYTGNTPIPGVAEFLAWLASTGRRFQCLTNNSTLTAAQYVAKLGRMGIPVEESQVLTSSQAAAIYLRERFGPGARLAAIGETGLVQVLLAEGFRLVADHHGPAGPPAAVVCGYNRRLTYEQLKHACLAIRAGAAFVATNPDLALPTEEGLLPGNGAALAYIQAATGVAPTVIGKPEATMLHVAMERLGATAGETAIVGDGLLTDILAGHRAGVATILVLTGVATRGDLAAASIRPDVVIECLPDLRRLLEA